MDVKGTALAIGLVLMAGSAAAQQPAPRTAEQRTLAYQISTMESVLARAVEHGAGVVRDRLQAVIPAQMLLTDSARVRGFPVPGYGMIFDVAVPGLDGTIPWSFRTLQEQNLDMNAAIKTLRDWVEKLDNPDVAQALQRVELQVAPAVPPFASDPPAGQADTLAQTTGSSFGLAAPTAELDARRAERGVDPILRNPDEYYRTEIRNAVMDAMLDHSLALNLGPDERLMVVAKSNEDLLLGAASPDARTTMISVSSADLGAFRAGQISREEARRRMVVTVF
jgi:hypothetical protein